VLIFRMEMHGTWVLVTPIPTDPTPVPRLEFNFAGWLGVAIK